MKRLFFIVVTILLTIGNVTAQSKKELKAQAKRQELVAATTDEDGTRYFVNNAYSHTIKPTVTRCSRSGSVVKIDMMVWNTSDDKDQELVFSGTEYAFATAKAEDNLGNVYDGAKTRCMTFDFRGADKDKLYYTTSPEFVPAGGPLKITLSIKGVKPDATKFNELSFLVYSSLNNAGSLGMRFQIAELSIE
ncbi:MAG: hypothetical protein SNI49_07630 [Rikenellaceae bacterium]